MSQYETFSSYEEMYKAQNENVNNQFSDQWKSTNSQTSYTGNYTLNYRSRATLQKRMEDYNFYLAVFPIGGVVLDIDTRQVQELRSSATKKFTGSHTFTINLFNIVDDIPQSSTWGNDTQSLTYFMRFASYEAAKQLIIYVHAIDCLKLEEKINLLTHLIEKHFGIKVLKNLYGVPLFFQYFRAHSTIINEDYWNAENKLQRDLKAYWVNNNIQPIDGTTYSFPARRYQFTGEFSILYNLEFIYTPTRTVNQFENDLVQNIGNNLYYPVPDITQFDELTLSTLNVENIKSKVENGSIFVSDVLDTDQIIVDQTLVVNNVQANSVTSSIIQGNNITVLDNLYSNGVTNLKETTVDGNLQVNNSVQVGDSIQVDDSIQVSNSIQVDNNVTISGELTANTGQFSGNIDVSGNFTVDQAIRTRIIAVDEIEEFTPGINKLKIGHGENFVLDISGSVIANNINMDQLNTTGIDIG